MAHGWQDADDGMGTVTRAWDEWFYVDRDQRVWLSTTTEVAARYYEEEWQKIQREPGDPDGPDMADVYWTRVGGLMPHEHEWLTLSAVVRDAVSAYEIYVVKAFEELLARHGKELRRRERMPPWRTIARLYAVLDLDPRPPRVEEILELRNLLTHRRGELRHAQDRARFAAKGSVWGDQLVHLDRPQVLGYMHTLGEATRTLDPLTWAYSYGGLRVPGLEPQRF